jgi:hypothetical protein
MTSEICRICHLDDVNLNCKYAHKYHIDCLIKWCRISKNIFRCILCFDDLECSTRRVKRRCNLLNVNKSSKKKLTYKLAT